MVLFGLDFFLIKLSIDIDIEEEKLRSVKKIWLSERQWIEFFSPGTPSHVNTKPKSDSYISCIKLYFMHVYDVYM